MNEYDIATWGAIVGFVMMMVFSLSLSSSLWRCFDGWMKRRGKPFSYRVWASRCVPIFFFLALYFHDGFSIPAKVLAGLIIVEMLINNPWWVRSYEVRQAQKETKA